VKIAVVQHRLRPAPAQDLEALVLACSRSAALGAEVVFLPDVAAVHNGPLADDLFRRMGKDAPGLTVFVAHRDARGDTGLARDDVGPLRGVILLAGDDAVDPEILHACTELRPAVVALAPGSESELQAQAVLELAIALSTSLASVVVVAETDGAEVGEAGHGGSAIVHLGQVLAEAVAGDDLLMADIALPLGPPEAPEALPTVPPVLTQRLGAHRGRKVDVDYPADLT